MRSWLLMILLLLSILIHDTQGIRLIRKGSLPADTQHGIHFFPEGKTSRKRSVEGVIECKNKACSGKRMKRKLSKVEKEPPHHWLPRIHEDYYGPRVHRPKHH